MTDAKKEMVKEGGRLVVFAAVAALITYVLNQVATLPETQTTVVLTLVLRMADKLIHESKATNRNGLVPF